MLRVTHTFLALLYLLSLSVLTLSNRLVAQVIEEFDVPRGTHPHDVAPAADGKVWYTAQGMGSLGLLDPATGNLAQIPLGEGSSPHGVIVGPDGNAWVTDSGLNAIVRVEGKSHEVTRYDLPSTTGYANLNTAVFDKTRTLWFTGQSGIYGKLEIDSGNITVYHSPKGRGPYGIAVTPDGAVYYVSLAGSYLGRINMKSGAVDVLEPPTKRQGARRVWSDSKGNLWVSEWNGGKLAMYVPATGNWSEWALPGENPKPYSVYVDENDLVWLSDFGANSLASFDPLTEKFTSYPLPSKRGAVRQLHGRPGEVWGAESGQDKIVRLRTR